MAFSLSSCSKEDKDEVTILGTWRCYTDKAKGYYYQITLKEDRTLIWHEINDHENETINKNSTYTYKDGCITWYWENRVECIWYVSLLYKTEMITYRVNKYTGERYEDERNIWVKIK